LKQRQFFDLVKDSASERERTKKWIVRKYAYDILYI